MSIPSVVPIAQKPTPKKPETQADSFGRFTSIFVIFAEGMILKKIKIGSEVLEKILLSHFLKPVSGSFAVFEFSHPFHSLGSVSVSHFYLENLPFAPVELCTADTGGYLTP